MDFDQLRYFVSVAQTLNFTQAAQLHYITQPAMSRRITELEKELGSKLFIRNSHNVALTLAGEEFLRYSMDVLDADTEVRNRVRAISKGYTGRIRISAVATAPHVLQSVLSHYTRLHPNVQIDLDFSTGTDQISAIKKGEYDFFFSFENLLRDSGRLECMITDLDRYYLLVPSQYAHKVDISDFSSLSPMPMVTEAHSKGPYLVEQMFDICRARGFDTENIITCNSLQTVTAFTSAGMGFTMLPKGMLRSICTDYLVQFSIPGDDAVTRNAVGWYPDSTNSTAASFIEVLRELYGGSNA